MARGASTQPAWAIVDQARPQRVLGAQGDEIAEGHRGQGEDADDQPDREAIIAPGAGQHDEWGEQDDRAAERRGLGDGGEIGGDRLVGDGEGLRGPGVEGHGRQLETHAREQEKDREQQDPVPVGVLDGRAHGVGAEGGISGREDPQGDPDREQREGGQRDHEQRQRAALGPTAARERDERDGGQRREFDGDEPGRQVPGGGQHGRSGGRREHQGDGHGRPAALHVIELASARAEHEQHDQGPGQDDQLQPETPGFDFIEAAALWGRQTQGAGRGVGGHGIREGAETGTEGDEREGKVAAPGFGGEHIEDEHKQGSQRGREDRARTHASMVTRSAITRAPPGRWRWGARHTGRAPGQGSRGSTRRR